MRTTTRALVTLPLLALLSACGGDSESSDAGNDQAEPAAACEDVPASVARRILGGTDGPKLAYVDAAAVAAPERKQTYWVAIRFTTAGLDGEDVGVWATDSIKPGPLTVIAVDGFAKEFTHWPDGDSSAYAITQTEAGVADAEGCVS